MLHVLTMTPLNKSRRWRWAVWLQIATSFMACLLACLASGEPTNAAASSDAEALAIVVNKANPVENLSIEELRKYFRMDHERWPDGRKNTVLMLPSGTPEREAVLRQIYQFDESFFTRHFLQASYIGQVHSAPKELASPVNMRKFIFNVPGAIGYVRASQLDDTVKVVRIDGHLPGDSEYRLKVASK
jgi:phosphate transport system substrate-binding protein